MSHEKTEQSNQGPAKSGRLSFLDQVVFDDARVDCSNFEERVNDLLDMRKRPEEDVLLIEHADKCPKCQQILHEYVSVNDSLKLLKDDIAALMNESSEPKEDERRSRAWKFFAILAAVLVMLASAWLLEFPSRSNSRAASRSVAIRVQHEFGQPTLIDRSDVSDFTQKLANRSTLLGLAYPDFDVELPPFNHVVFDMPISQLTYQLEQIDPSAWYPPELPSVVVPATVTPVNMTWEILRTISRTGESQSKDSKSEDPDLGAMFQSPYIAMI